MKMEAKRMDLRRKEVKEFHRRIEGSGDCKVYLDPEFGHMMIYSHKLRCACWGETYYNVSFKRIAKYWVEIGKL